MLGHSNSFTCDLRGVHQEPLTVQGSVANEKKIGWRREDRFARCVCQKPALRGIQRTEIDSCRARLICLDEEQKLPAIRQELRLKMLFSGGAVWRGNSRPNASIHRNMEQAAAIRAIDENLSRYAPGAARGSQRFRNRPNVAV